MAEQNNATPEIKLEEGEIMRVSVRKRDDGLYETHLATNGPTSPMIQGIMHAASHFGITGMTPPVAVVCIRAEKEEEQ